MTYRAFRYLSFCILLASCIACNSGSGNDDPAPVDSTIARPLEADSIYTDADIIDSSPPIDTTYSTEYDPEKEMAEARYIRVKNMLVFHINDTMSVDTTYYASLALGKNVTLAALEKEINEIFQPGAEIKLMDTTIIVSLQMSATLEDKSSKDNPNFNIANLGEGVNNSNVRKYDPQSNSMLWRWKVTPKEAGTHELILTIAEIDKKGDVKHPEHRQYRVLIFSKKGRKGPGFGNFLNNNWQWLVGVIMMPLFVAWFTTRRRNRISKQSPRDNY